MDSLDIVSVRSRFHQTCNGMFGTFITKKNRIVVLFVATDHLASKPIWVSDLPFLHLKYLAQATN